LINNKNLSDSLELVYMGSNDINFETGIQTVIDPYIPVNFFRKIEGGREYYCPPNMNVYLYDDMKKFIRKISFNEIYNSNFNDIPIGSFIWIPYIQNSPKDIQLAVLNKKPWTDSLRQILNNKKK